MRVTVDTEKNVVLVEGDSGTDKYAMDSPEAFAAISKMWLRCGWDTKYVYSFTWMGRPLIQLPDDMLRIQELIYSVKPDVVIETGVAHGGGLIFYASLCKAMGKGRVIGVDIEIRPHNRSAIEAHELFDRIQLIEGSSIDKSVVEKVSGMINPDERVLICLDSNHTRDHVLAELEAYSSLVPIDSYIVAMDGIRRDLVGAPRTEETWVWDNPAKAAEEFVSNNDNFIVEEPEIPFNEGVVKDRVVTYWPGCFVRRIR